MSWSEGYNADTYRVIVKDLDGNTVKTVNTPLTSIRITGLTADTTYNIEVYSLYGNDLSADCAALTASTDVVKKLTKPVVMVDNAAAEGTVKVYWNVVEGAVDYRLQFKKADDPSASWITYDKLTTNFGNIGGLAAGTKYVFRVRANGDNIDYYNSDSATVSFVVGS